MACREDQLLVMAPAASCISPVKQRQALAWGGIVGPTGFVAAWVVAAWVTAGALTKGSSPAEEAISQFAAMHTPTRWLMTAGFATLGAGAFPLDASSTIDLVHRGFATVGSASLALTPVLAARSLSARGHGRAAAASRLVGVLSGACLAATAFVSAQGLLQRIGLTLAHGWLVASAVAIIRGLMKPTRVPPQKQPGTRSGC